MLLFGIHVSRVDAAYEISDGSIKGLWHLEDGVDSSGNGYNLTLSNITTSSALLSNGFVVVTSSDATHSANLTLPVTGWSYGGWIKVTTLPGAGGQNIIEVHDNVTKNFSALNYIREGGTLYMWNAFQRNGVDNCYVQYAETLNVGQWYHVVMNVDGTVMTMFQDGVALASSTCPNTGGNAGDTNIVRIANGTQQTDTGGFMLDEVFHRTVSSSVAVIQALYASGSGVEICVTVGCAGGGVSAGTSSVTFGDVLAPLNVIDLIVDVLALIGIPWLWNKQKKYGY